MARRNFPGQVLYRLRGWPDRLPGMGALVLNGIQGRDQPVVLAGLVAAALAIVLINALTALLQSWLDPRQSSRD